MMLSSAFNFLIDLTGKEVTIRRGATTYVVKMAKSNYNRNLETVSYTVTKGREYVVSALKLDEVGLGKIKIKDTVVIDDDTLSIVEVNEMVDIGGAVMGYRVRTN